MDIERIVNEMIEAASDAVQDDIGDIREYAKQIVENEKDSLEELGRARISGIIDDDTFDSEIERQKKVVETELLTIRIMTESAAQQAVNAAMDTFRNAVKALV